MQTFLPFDDFHRSAEVLDNKRLGKQRVEAFQILNTLTGKSKGWANHPAVRMWRNYDKALTDYMNVCISEWKRRGFKNTMEIVPISLPFELPEWFGMGEFHLSHQSNLVRKDPVFYGSKFPNVPDNLPYVWPL